MTFVKMRMSQPQIVLEAVISVEITALQGYRYASCHLPQGNGQDGHNVIRW